MKIGVFSDLHSNLPALRVILDKFKEEQCESIYSLGDNIAIGPYPKECMELLLTIPNLKFIMGNHEEYFINGLAQYPSMEKGEKNHQIWVANQLNDDLKEKLKQFPYVIIEEIEGVKVAFMHYALENHQIRSVVKELTSEKCDVLFSNVDADVIFYGHEHKPSYLIGQKHYMNVGSSGCTKDDLTHCSSIEFKDNTFHYQVFKMKYDKNSVLEELNNREVPEREFIKKIFF